MDGDVNKSARAYKLVLEFNFEFTLINFKLKIGHKLALQYAEQIEHRKPH